MSSNRFISRMGSVAGLGLVAFTASAGVEAQPYLNSNSVRIERLETILQVGESAANGYRMVGVPDGLGAYPMKDGTLRLYMNHELSQGAGIPRAHGATGSFVSEWTIGFVPSDEGSLSFVVTSGQDAFDTVYDWDGSAYVAATGSFQSFCSAYLAGPQNDFDRYVFMTGEETPGTGNFDGIAGGQSWAVFDGAAWALPRLGRFSHEQQLLLTGTGNKTVVWGCDDFFGGTPAHVFMYVGEKDPGSSDPLAINGLSTGELYVLKLAGAADEGDTVKGVSYAATFEPVNWDQDTTGLHNEAGGLGAMGFIRIEDAQYDPTNPGVLYFVTTGAPTTPDNLFGRGYKFTFNDITDPLAGGTLEVIIDGSEGIVSPDNIGLDKNGNLLIQEDPNYNLLGELGLSRDASIWLYRTGSGSLERVLEMNTLLAGSIDGGYYPGKWETSGIIDAEDILGPGWWLFDVQAHYNLADPELVQGGQLLAVQLGFGATDAPSYLAAVSDRAKRVDPILTVGDSVDGYRMVGIPDGMGAYDMGDGTFRLLLNHELNQTAGIPRAHGGTGAFVSDWTIGFDGDGIDTAYNVASGSDLIQQVQDYDDGTGEYVEVINGQFARLCSAFLAGPEVGFETMAFLTGEETGNSGTLDGIQGGQSFAVIDGTAWALPRLGRSAKENQVVLPGTGETTVAIALDDSNPAYVWVYVGTKEPDSDFVLDRLGFTNGSLYTVVADGVASENDLVKGVSVPFSLAKVDWTLPGGELKAQAAALNAMQFVRIEDGANNPSVPGQFWFDTTGGLGTGNDNGKLHRLDFSDLGNVLAGGTITNALDGSEGVVSPDNIDVNTNGQLVLCEDPNYDLIGRNSSVWLYEIGTGEVTRIVEIDQALQESLEPGSPLGNWEISGAIDASSILGADWWLVNVQAHYSIGDPELVEGGQILAVRIGDGSTGPIDGDVNGDGKVDGSDLGLVLAGWGSADPSLDLNGDGQVDGADLGIVLANWTG